MTKNIKAVLFDAFGTLCRIDNPQLPYRLLMKRWPKGVADCYQTIMTRDISMETLAVEAGLSHDEIAALNEKVDLEIQSMSLYPEVKQTLDTLRDHGIKVAVVSNLAKPYGKPLRELFSYEPDEWALSYEVGSRKPEDFIYRYIQDFFAFSPERLLMIGDSFQNDYEKPLSLGIQALWLNRRSILQHSEEEYTVSAVDQILNIVGI